KPALRDLAGEVASVDALCHAGLHCAVQAPVGAKRISGNRGTESPAGKETVGVRTYSAVRIPNAEIDRRRVFAEITVAHTSCGNREDLVAVQMQNLMVERRKEERPVAAVVHLGNHHRPAERATEIV